MNNLQLLWLGFELQLCSVWNLFHPSCELNHFPATYNNNQSSFECIWVEDLWFVGKRKIDLVEELQRRLDGANLNTRVPLASAKVAKLRDRVMGRSNLLVALGLDKYVVPPDE